MHPQSNTTLPNSITKFRKTTPKVGTTSPENIVSAYLERGLVKAARKGVQQGGFAGTRGAQQQRDAAWPQYSTDIIKDGEAGLGGLHQPHLLYFALQQRADFRSQRSPDKTCTGLFCQLD